MENCNLTGQRKLASIQRIAEKKAIPGADAIESVRVGGWWCVTKKAEFQVGDMCIYFEIDSLLPLKPEFESLRQTFTERHQRYRLRTVKIRGQISQGLAFPLTASLFPADFELDKVVVGQDVTEVLDIKKWEAVGAVVKNQLPSILPDMEGMCLESLEETELFEGREVHKSVKLDGIFVAYGIDPETNQFFACSRRAVRENVPGDLFWDMAKTLNLEARLREQFPETVILGEICGPNLLKNKNELDKHQFFIFGAYEFQRKAYVDLPDVKSIADRLEVPMTKRFVKSTTRIPFPAFLPKTDEMRLQSAVEVLQEIEGLEIYETLKLDGTSATFCIDPDTDQFLVCSRNLIRARVPKDLYWEMAKKLNLEEKLRAFNTDMNLSNIAIQGEICGPEIQKNPLGLRRNAFYMFNAYDTKKQAYLDFADMKRVAKQLEVEVVPILYVGSPRYKNVEEWLAYSSTLKYANDSFAEGIVVRPTKETPSKYLERLSFKVISNAFLLKSRQ